jgi:hypothetical protein
MTIYDLASGYWQVPIFPPHLSLSFQHEYKSYYFWVWVLMPLDIVDAAHIFITDPLMSCILLKGKHANIYFYYLFSACQGYKLALLQDKFIQDFFEKGDWVFKPSKSSGLPSQRVTFLGLIFDSSRWNLRFH